MVTVSEAVSGRCSVRDFLPKPVPKQLLRAVFDQAQRAPSGGNVQPWHVHVVSGAAREVLVSKVRAAMMQNPKGEGSEFMIYPDPMPEPYRARRLKVAADLYTRLGIGREDKLARAMAMAQNFDFFGAPVGVFFSIDRIMAPNQWAHMGMYMQTLALLAEEQGLGTCMQEAWAVFYKTVGAFLALPEERMLYCGMALGYPNPTATVNGLETDRAVLDEVVTFLS